jgi:predicted flap endonuclease-1-like 5' DNA nuclease
MAKLTNIEGIGTTNAQKLKKVGISTTEALLEKGALPKGRNEICETTGIGEKQILHWVNLADLFRIKGVGEEYSDLLEAAGVDTVPEMAQRNSESLYNTLVTINSEKKLVRQVPSQTTIANWIEHARTLPRVVKH